MKYTVTLKILYPDGYVGWESRIVVDNAEDAATATEKAKTVIMKSVAFKDCQVVDTRVSEYKQGDEKRLTYDAQRWELEEEKENAPANIARALNRIADKMGQNQDSIAKKTDNNIAVAAFITAVILVIVIKILILIFRQ